MFATNKAGKRRVGWLQQLGGEARHGAPFARTEGDVPEARLPPEGVDEHSQRVVRLAEVGRIDLARIAGEHHLGALADSREDCLQRGGLEVLRLVDDHHLTVERSAAEERDAFE